MSVQLGDAKSNIADTIAVQGQEISSAPTVDEVRKIAHIIAENIVADFIEAGTISADRIEGGTLSLGKQYNESGFIRIYDEENRFIGAMYNRGLWFGNGAFSSLQDTNGFTIRKVIDDDGNVENMVYIGRTISDGSGVDKGMIEVSSVDNSGIKTINAYIRGDGTLVCKRLFVSGHEITEGGHHMADYTLQYTAAEIDNRLGRPVPVNQGGTGQTAIWENVTISANNTNTTDFGANCRFNPYLRLVFIRGSFKTAVATTANTWISVANIPADYRPSTYNPAITISIPGGASGLITRSDGNINIRPIVDRAAGTSVDFSGWWFV
jgi:hypothetical protein